MRSRLLLVFLACLFTLCDSGCAHRHTPKGGVDRSRGATLYVKNCAACHGAEPGARIGPSLQGVGHRLSSAQITAIIEDPDPPMPKLYPSVLTAEDVGDISAYVKNL